MCCCLRIWKIGARLFVELTLKGNSSSCRRVYMVFRKMAEGSHMLYVYNVNKIVYRHSVELSRLATQYICKYFFSFFGWGGGEEGGICGAILC